jgi:diguanylate cyclase (GGDEF)-like protein
MARPGPDSADTDVVRPRDRHPPAGDGGLDPLTGLADRRRLECHLRSLEHEAPGGTGGITALLFVNLDNFRYVNNSLGHTAGDRVLVETARRLLAATGADHGPAPLVARFGGDGFVVLLERIASIDEARGLAGRIAASIAAPMQVGSECVAVHCSIGIATRDRGAAGPRADLLRDADTAVHHAKTAAKGRHAVFVPSMHAAATRRLRLESDLRDAVSAGQIGAVYQPIVHLDTGRVVSFEALARWQHPELGAIGPDEFIPIAEENGLVVPLAYTLLGRAIDVLERLSRLPGGEAVRMNVNVSRRQLSDPTFLPTLATLVGNLSVAPGRLCLEITESAVTTAPADIRDALHEIKALGLQLHLDDFGTGLSSLSLLRTLPLDGIKVDRSFIEAAGSREAIAILHAIITLGRNLRKVTTAEGLETTTHMATVLALECDLAQGFLLGRPVDATDAAAVLTADFSSRVAIGRAWEDALAAPDSERRRH